MIASAHSLNTASYLGCAAISKSFGKNLVLDSLSLDVREGEFLSLLGPSGCGKTTLLRIVAGLEKADSGSVLLDSQDLTQQPPAMRGFGIVFQSYALYPNMTALENVGFGLRARGLPLQKRNLAAREMLARVGLADSEEKYPSQLSGGQQQRVALARVLVLSPRLLLLDEPFSALDARVRFQLRQQVREMQRELGITTLLVTHDQEEAMMVSDRIALMRNGRFEQIGTARQIYAAPATEFVADFIGSMNFFRDQQIAELCTHVNGIDINSIGATCLAVRPESFMLGQGSNDDCTLSAKLIDIEFRGSTCRIIAQTTSGLRVLADLSPQDTMLQSLCVNEPITLHVNRSAILQYHNGQLKDSASC